MANVYRHSHAKLSEARPRTLADTCARNRPNGHGNNSSWSQQMWFWQCCDSGNKLLVILDPRGRFAKHCGQWWNEHTCCTFVVATDGGRVAKTSKLFTDPEVKETLLHTDVHVLVAARPNGIPPPSVPFDEQVPPPIVATSCCPLSVNRFYKKERCVLRHSRPRLFCCGPNPLQETCTKSQTWLCCFGMWQSVLRLRCDPGEPSMSANTSQRFRATRFLWSLACQRKPNAANPMSCSPRGA